VKEVLLGIDVGTTWCKAAVVDPTGREHPVDRVSTPWRPVATGAEADPEEILTAVLKAARQAIAAGPSGARITAIGVTGMAEAGVLLGRSGEPLAPVIAWYDTRGAAQAKRLAAELPEFSARTGLPTTTTCSIVKLAQLAAEQGVRGVRWLSLPEWVVYRLGGEQVAELSLAARTGYLDVAGRRWWDTALRWAGAPPGFLPEPVVAGTPAGHAKAALAKGAILTVAGHDHTCAAFGAGAVGEGDVLDSCGTAEALVRAVPPPLSQLVVQSAVARGLNVGWHVVPGLMSMVGGFLSGRLLAGVDLGSPAAEPIVAAIAEKAATLLAAMDDLAGPHRRLVVTGGGARPEVVRRYKRSTLGHYEMAATEECGVRGAALLAGKAAGINEMADGRSAASR
jgi:sugar (pentulose or hexulose) kinase